MGAIAAATIEALRRKACEGKEKHYSPVVATKFAYSMEQRCPGESFDVYRCEFCWTWHVGHALRCDWCGEPFLEGECPVEGYENLPTHKKCARYAWKAYSRDTFDSRYDDRPAREPFNDWPNGQGTYD